MEGFALDEATEEQVAAEAAVFGPLAQVVRELAEASVRTEVDEDTVREATADLRAVLDRLRRTQAPGPFGVRYRSDGHARAWGNAVVGLRNPIAPPLDVHRDPAGRAWADFHLGATYEGPPGLVHGGVSALLLDQLLGEAAGAGGKPGMTGTLTLRYRRGTPLGDLHGEAHIDRVEGIKTFVVGHLADAEGVCVEAEGVFILPRWARDAAEAEKPERFE